LIGFQIVPLAAVSEPGYMLAIALVTARPIVAQTMPAMGPVMSWLAVTPYLVFVYRVQSACLIQAPVHDPATALMAWSMRKDLSLRGVQYTRLRIAALESTHLDEMLLDGGKKSAPPFRAIAQMNTPNMVIVTPACDIHTKGLSLDG
jgi:hypothetical protein